MPIAELTERDFTRLCALIRQLTGIHLGDGKRELVASRLRRRLEHLGLDSYGAYHDLVASGAGGEAERVQLVNCITTNKTDFFREPHHFQTLRRLAVAWRDAGRRRLRLWSAGCSTGEEPYSIAIALHDLLPPDRVDLRILATDIDTEVLAHAREAWYRRDRITGVPGLERHLEPDGDGVRVRACYRDRVDLRPLNLMGPWDHAEPFDAIFCRNVIIYFDRPTQDALFERFAHQLVPGGHLFLGHSESIVGTTGGFELVGQTVYRLPAGPTRAVRAALAPPVRPTAPAGPITTQALRALGYPHKRVVVGEAVACREPTRLSTLLGSCVSACLWDPRAGVGGMNHFLLPVSSGDPASSARYGIHAMNLLIQRIVEAGGERTRLQAKLFGAGAVLDIAGSPVPRENAAFAREFLRGAGIPVKTERLGGALPLEVHFFTDSGRAVVRELAGNTPSVRRAEERAAQRLREVSAAAVDPEPAP